MKRLVCCLLGVSCSLAGFSQISFNNIFETGVALPLNGQSANGARNAGGIHIGNHLDLSFGNDCFKWGIGAYIGHTGSLGADNKYREEGMALALKYQLPVSQISFNASPFQSTQFLLGPVAGLGTGRTTLHVWAKGGLGLNTPGRYAVTYREGNAEQKIYETVSTENKTALAYDIGAGFAYSFSPQLGLRLSAGYNSTKTDLVNYRYDREKGTIPLYRSSTNAFIRASVGLVFHLSAPGSANPRMFYSPGRASRAKARGGTGAGRGETREAGTGLATGRRMHRPATITTTGDSVSYSKREGATGLAMGRRMHKPVVITIEPGVDAAFESREAGSGLATGRRMHKPVVITIEPGVDAAFESREAGSGLATGRRMHKPVVITIDPGADAAFESREAGSGLATGRRMHKPVVITIDPGVDAAFESREAGSGLATGRRMHKPVVITIDPDEVDVQPAQNQSKSSGDNPLYESSGTKGENPLFEGMIKPEGTGNASNGTIKRINKVTLYGDDAEIEGIMEKNGTEYRISIKGKVIKRTALPKP